MKKVVSNTGDVISFLVKGVRHSDSAVELFIDEKGVVVADADAKLLADRLGSQVTVSDIDVKAAKKEAEEALKEAEAELKNETAKKTTTKKDK